MSLFYLLVQFVIENSQPIYVLYKSICVMVVYVPRFQYSQPVSDQETTITQSTELHSPTRYVCVSFPGCSVSGLASFPGCSASGLASFPGCSASGPASFPGLTQSSLGLGTRLVQVVQSKLEWRIEPGVVPLQKHLEPRSKGNRNQIVFRADQLIKLTCEKPKSKYQQHQGGVAAILPFEPTVNEAIMSFQSYNPLRTLGARLQEVKCQHHCHCHNCHTKEGCTIL